MKRLTIKATALILAISLLVVTTACDNSKLAKQADIAGNALNQARTAFNLAASNGLISPAAALRIDNLLIQGSDDAHKLAELLRAGPAGTGTLAAITALIKIVDQLIDFDAKLIPAGPVRTTVLAILAAADIALGFIANQLNTAAKTSTGMIVAAAAPSSDASLIRAFANKPRLKCRSSVTGQYQKMEQCKSDPSHTVVER